MRFTRLIPALAVPMLVVACDQNDATAPDPPQLNEQAASIPKLEVPWVIYFTDLNPCTGLEITGTATVTVWIQEHPNNRTIRFRGTATTSDGYTGSWNETWTGSNIFGPGNVSNLSINNVLTNPAGSRYKMHQVWIADFKTDPPTIRVDKIGSTCIRP
jgi:hypothetical protein